MERIRQNLSYANVAATLALVFAMSGGAIAATGGFTASNSIKACAGSGGVLKLQTGKKCKKGQKSVAWNQTGPAGAKGPAGAPGAAGAAGAAGARGVTGEAANVSWARVAEKGALEGGHGVVSSEAVSVGFYVVTFDHDVTNCAVTATGRAVGPQVVASIAKPAGAEGPSKAVVETFNTDTELNESAPFSVVANC